MMYGATRPHTGKVSPITRQIIGESNTIIGDETTQQQQVIIHKGEHIAHNKHEQHAYIKYIEIHIIIQQQKTGANIIDKNTQNKYIGSPTNNKQGDIQKQVIDSINNIILVITQQKRIDIVVHIVSDASIGNKQQNVQDGNGTQFNDRIQLDVNIQHKHSGNKIQQIKLIQYGI